MAKVQDMALIELHPVDLSPVIQPVQIPSKGLPTSRQINISSHLGVICKHIEGAHNSLIQVINKDIEEDRP